MEVERVQITSNLDILTPLMEENGETIVLPRSPFPQQRLWLINPLVVVLNERKRRCVSVAGLMQQNANDEANLSCTH